MTTILNRKHYGSVTKVTRHDVEVRYMDIDPPRGLVQTYNRSDFGNNPPSEGDAIEAEVILRKTTPDPQETGQDDQPESELPDFGSCAVKGEIRF